MAGTMEELTSDNFQKWLDDMTSIDTTGYGTDTTPIPTDNAVTDYLNSHPLDPIALQIQQWILSKESGLNTRSAMGYGASYACARVLESIQLYNDIYRRQGDVEARMTKTEGDFQAVIGNATVDSEVILARDSDTYGKFATLDKRLEYDEQILAAFAPIGYQVTLNHGLGINPRVVVSYYEDAIGTETNGLGTAPAGLGEVNTQTVAVMVTYTDANTAVVNMPMKYKLNGTPEPMLDGNFYLIDGNKTLKFDIGGALKPKPNLIPDGGFESGQTPANYSWGDGKPTDDKRNFTVIPATSTFPTPFGKYMLRIENDNSDSSVVNDQYAQYPISPVSIKAGETWTYSYDYATAGSARGQASDYLILNNGSALFAMAMAHGSRETSGDQTTWHRFTGTWTADSDRTISSLRFGFVKTSNAPGWLCIDNIKLEKSSFATPFE